MPQVDANPTTPTVAPGGAPPPAQPEPAALFLPPGPQDIRIDRQEGNLPPPAMMADPDGAMPLAWVMEDEDGDDALPEPRPSAIMIGRAGVHFVLSRLLSWGVHAYAADPGLPYDIIVEVGREVSPIRLQVMSTAQPPRGRCYRFALTRGFHGSAHGVFPYQPGDFDVAAFVPLGLDRVLFRPFGEATFAATPAEFCAPQAEQQSWRLALAAALFLPPGPGDIRFDGQDREAEGPRDIMIGEAGVHFVLSRLLSRGIRAQAAGAGLPYDAIAHVGGEVSPIRLQVKTTARPPRGRRYRFALKRGFHGSAHGVFAYRAGDFHVAAFVPLGLDRVLFRPFGEATFAATPAEFRAPLAEQQSWRLALAALRARRPV